MGPSAREENLAMNVPVRMEEDARTEDPTSDASADMVGLERPAQKGTLALAGPVTTEEVARRMEKISNALVWLDGPARHARRRRTSARGWPAATTGRASQRLWVCRSLRGADVTLVLPAVRVKTTFARE